MKKIFIIILFFIHFQWINAQPPNLQFRHLNVEQGLSDRTVTAIVQDSLGFIWVGTTNGLNRYDGYNFKTFLYQPNDTNSISNNYINDLLVDNRGWLWIATDNGLSVLKSGCTGFLNFYHKKNDKKSLCSNAIKNIYQDSKNNVWLATWNGLAKYNVDENNFDNFYPEKNNDKEGNWLTDITEDKQGNLVIGARKAGLYYFDTKNSTFTNYKHNPRDKTSIGSNYIRSVLCDSKGRIWVGSWDKGIFEFTVNNNSFKKYDLYAPEESGINHQRVNVIYQDHDQRIWIGTEIGLKYFNPDKKKIYTYFHYKENFYSLSRKVVLSVFHDNSSGLWIGTSGGGINYYNKNLFKFSSTYQSSGEKFPGEDDWKNKIVRTFLKDSTGNLWLGTENGLHCFNFNEKKSRVYLHADTYKKAKGNVPVNALLMDSTGLIWIGTNQGMFTFNAENNSINQVPLKSEKYPDGYYKQITDITFYDKNRLLINTDDDIILYHLKTQTMLFLNEISLLKEKLNNQGIQLLVDHKMNIWIPAWGNLIKYNFKRRSIKQFKYRKNPTKSIINPTIRILYEDSKHNIWIGTNGGLQCYIPAVNHFIHYTTEHGLPNNQISGILEASNGNLWISTENGLSCFNPNTQQFKNYYVENGLQSNYFNSRACYRSPDGTLYFGGIDGYNAFLPENIVENSFVPPVHILDFKIFYKSILPGENKVLNKPITHTQKIILAHWQSVISFDFVALSYTNPQKNIYLYKMEGFDKDWIQSPPNKRTAQYMNLNPGKYTFKVKAANNEGYWNNEGTSIDIIIKPPFWKTWWAYGLYILIFAVSLFFFRRLILMRERFNNELKTRKLISQKQHELDTMKIRFFTNISHEFRTPVTLIINPLKKLLNTTDIQPDIVRDYYQMMYRNAQRLLELINQLLDFRKLDTNRLSLEISQADLSLFLKEIISSFTFSAREHDIALSFDATHQFSTAWFDKDKLQKIVTNLISNALKFTPPGGKVKLSLSRTDSGNAIIKVIDTGRGIPQEKLDKIFSRFYQVNDVADKYTGGTGIGLTLTKEMVELHRGKIRVESQPDKGTSFTVEFPVEKSAYKVHEVKEYLQITENEQEEYVEEIENKSQSGGLPLVLVVDDVADIRNYIRIELQNLYKIEESSNGKEALEKAEKLIPDLIVSDVMMPEMDGIKLCQLLKNNPDTSHIPVILLTAKSTEEHTAAGLKSGADDYVSKPFNMKLLAIRIKNLIDSRNLLRKRFRSEISLEPEEITITPVDADFLKQAMKIVEENMDNPDFNNQFFVREMRMGRTSIYKKLKGLTGQTINEFIRTVRLKRAAQLLVQNSATISEIAYTVGFKTPAYFSHCFHQQFKITPTEYLEKNKLK